MITRRRVLETMAVGAFVATAARWLPIAPAAWAQDAKPEELNQAGPLGDVTLGNPDAKVNIIEYASLTCSHCAEFHEKTLPMLKSKYIDTGKVRFTLREFPLDPLATAGFMLARCQGNDKYYPISDLLFSKQQQWAFNDKPLDGLAQLVKQAGYTQESFEACLKNQKIYDAVVAERDRGAKLGVNSTPTLFINGKVYRGALEPAEMEKTLAPLLAG
ncbi:DsbA family protein [Chelatococcus reniformis]|uniref:Disulfide bond formation protein DsbD n=1 Tax=Chelatococcus reniformis TaxID=1494448 RepID=A0A916XD10_9HYPH|nr:DsbA family protein [Chelatococcus reniformis]GGC62714.1 disulfide bond formation protein DsbD [Chelatococcus reniformis]